MNKKKIIKYVASGLLATTLLTGAGLAIHDTHVDHTEEICPITKILNVFPSYDELDGESIPAGAQFHQYFQMISDYHDKGVEDVDIWFCPFIEEVEEIETVLPIIIKNEDGSETYAAPIGYFITRDENGNVVCQKTSVSTKKNGLGLAAGLGGFYDENDNGIYKYEHEKVLKIKD